MATAFDNDPVVQKIAAAMRREALVAQAERDLLCAAGYRSPEYLIGPALAAAKAQVKLVVLGVGLLEHTSATKDGARELAEEIPEIEALITEELFGG